MQKLDILREGPFRYVHCTSTGKLLTTLVRQQDGRFVEEEGEDAPVGRTLRQWKAIIARGVKD